MKKLISISMIAISTMTAFKVKAEIIFGNYDCGEWVEARPGSRPWVLGYLSGMNAVTAKKGYDPLKQIGSAEQIFLWIDNYCKANPLDSVAIGGSALYLELMKKTK